MATDKKSFILYSDSQGLINQLPDDVAGRLLKHIYAYVNDENPISEELLLNIAFEPIKMQFKRDLKKWEESKDAKSINGKMGNLKRYNLDLYDLVSQNKMTLEDAENVAKSRKASQGDSKQSQSVANVAVNDNVNVNDNVINTSYIKNTNKHNEFLKTCLEQPTWIEEVSRREKIPLEKIHLALKDFNGHLITTGEDKIYLKDYKYHFVMWVKKRKLI